MQPGTDVANAIRSGAARGGPALIAYLTAGFPTKGDFEEALEQAIEIADVVEVGVPFSDPMADGLTIQQSSRIALEQGTTLEGTLGLLATRPSRAGAPLLLMSYLNPLLSYGTERLAQDAARAGVSGFIVPDLPFEECEPLKRVLDGAGLALVQMVTPVTPPARLALLAEQSRGFVYAVTRTGTTGHAVSADGELIAYLRRVRDASALPICAGFGIRSREHVAALAGQVDGCVVGSALVEVLGRGQSVAAFLRDLRA
jgi:tryptophan synthase alpha chain